MGDSTYKSVYDKSWAVVIGINAYKHAPPLGYAVNDAREFASTLISKYEFPKTNVSLLLDKDATRENIQQAMHKLTRKVDRDDRVVVFYAGHGHTIPAYGRDAGFLVPVEGKTEDTATLLPWDDLSSTSRIIPAKHMLFIMDACYGGLIGMRALAPGSQRFARNMLTRYSRQFFTAGKANEVVADSGGPRVGHSVFTGHLLDALDGGLQPSEGVLSANVLMAHVYDKVARDQYSFQAPHFGYLAGDGDLLFRAPDVAVEPDAVKETDDALIEIPADLLSPEETQVQPPILDLLKEYLSERRHRIRLDGLVRRELRAAQQRLGEENFSVHSGSVTGSDFAERLVKYEQAASDLLGICTLLGRWAETEQQGTLREVVHVLAGQIEAKGGIVLWLALRSYPMLLAMYCGGIGAIEGENYQSLHALFDTGVRDHRRSATIPVAMATSDAIVDVNRTNAFAAVPGYERRRTPMSDYLFARLQPIIEDTLLLGNRYEDHFDRFEILYALTCSEQNDRGWGPLGRFAWKFHGHYGGNDPFTRLLEEAKRDGDKWLPVRAGMFKGSYKRFEEVALHFKAMLEGLHW